MEKGKIDNIESLSGQNRYFFETNGLRVSVVLSADSSAPTVEDALVNIAMRKNY